jgi:xanthine dehydrogenase accessory factor
VKHWQESRQVFEWLSTLKVEQRRAALATVVSVHGSAYRREGAKMAVAEDGASVGNVSGGCLEMDVREVAREVIASGIPQLRSYCSTSDEVHAWDLGVGCEGEVRIFVERAYSASGIEQAFLDSAMPFAVCTVVDESPAARHRLIVTAAGCEGAAAPTDFSPAVVIEARSMLAARLPSALRDIAGHAVFIDVYLPPPQLLIVSAGNDARPLARFAAEVGFRTVVVDRRPGLLRRDRFPEAVRLIESSAAELTNHLELDAESCAVVMTHNYADDEHYLRALIATPVRYIGVLGPRQRTERLVGSIAADMSFDTGRIYGPVGLDVGTDGAEQVALAVVAELLAVRGGRRPRSLRDRETPIHLPHLA